MLPKVPGYQQGEMVAYCANSVFFPRLLGVYAR
jgi:hypothetical protein